MRLPAAVGAVAVAAVGVFGVFQMALYVAEHSGRSASDFLLYVHCYDSSDTAATMQGYLG